MTENEYLELPWSMEDTIKNLKDIKEMMILKVKSVNLDGKGESDVKEIAFDFDRAISALEEIQQYRIIGTIAECREAVEKQRAKKPILRMNEQSGIFVDYADGHGEYKTQMNNWWRCPCCNGVVGQRMIVHGKKSRPKKEKVL